MMKKAQNGFYILLRSQVFECSFAFNPQSSSLCLGAFVVSHSSLARHRAFETICPAKGARIIRIGRLKRGPLTMMML